MKVVASCGPATGSYSSVQAGASAAQPTVRLKRRLEKDMQAEISRDIGPRYRVIVFFPKGFASFNLS